MARYRVVVVGSGFGAKVHVPILEHHHAFEVAGLIGQTSHSAFRIMAERLRIPYYQGLDGWRQASVGADLAVVANPPYQHSAFLLEALKRGIPVLAEKPLAADASEAAQAVMAAQALGIPGWINFEFRMLESRRRLAARLHESSVVGRPLSFYWIQGGSGYPAYTGRPVSWLTERGLGGGYLGALGSHMLDYLLWLFGDVEHVQAMEVTEVKERTDGINHAEDGFTVLMQFVSGVTGVIHYRSASRKGLGSVLEITGTDGGYRLVNDKMLYAFDHTGVLTDLWAEDVQPEPRDPGYMCTEKIYDSIAAELSGTRTDLPTLREGLAVQRLMDAIHLSHETGLRCGVS